MTESEGPRARIGRLLLFAAVAFWCGRRLSRLPAASASIWVRSRVLDAFGYVSASFLWANGLLGLDLSSTAALPWPAAAGAFVRISPGKPHRNGTDVASGLPLLMAFARAFSDCGPYFVATTTALMHRRISSTLTPSAGSPPPLHHPGGAHLTVELGSIDGSVGGNNFTPAQFLDYLSSLKLTWAMISLPQAVLADEAAIRQVREHADRLGIKLQLAYGSLCPTARAFNAQAGTIEEQVSRALKASQIFGAKCMRCILGGDPERPQIETHIENMVKAVRPVRSRILDSGVKLAVENHGGDLQAREMKMMIEAVGPDVMGVCLDSGNPVWMLEDPHLTLETLIPYAETSHVRDSAVWKTPEGIAVRWVNMGDGNVDIDGWIRKFVQAKPGLPIIFENLVSGNPRVHAIYNPQFWDNWRKMPAADFARFAAIADRGTPKPATPRAPGKTAGQQRIEDLEVCVRYTRELLQRL